MVTERIVGGEERCRVLVSAFDLSLHIWSGLLNSFLDTPPPFTFPLSGPPDSRSDHRLWSLISRFATTNALTLLAHRLDALEAALVKTGALLPADLEHFLS